MVFRINYHDMFTGSCIIFSVHFTAIMATISHHGSIDPRNSFGASVLRDVDTESEHLILFDADNLVPWVYFDFPTDSFSPSEKLTVERKLGANVSASNWTDGGNALQYHNFKELQDVTDYGYTADVNIFSRNVSYPLTCQSNYSRGLSKDRRTELIDIHRVLSLLDRGPEQPAMIDKEYWRARERGEWRRRQEGMIRKKVKSGDRTRRERKRPQFVSKQSYMPIAIQGASPAPEPPPQRSPFKTAILVILGWAIGAFTVLVSAICLKMFIIRKNKKQREVDQQDYLDNMPGKPARFPFEVLRTATNNFSKKLGQGAFGTVFEGLLIDGSKIAVKCLTGIGMKKTFMAEVKTLGNVHHVSLVRLVGFCAEESHMLLVYEYMSNGSLEKWIYKGSQDFSLDWKSRKKTLLDVAKGIAYLHEECRQTIIHLDIKPQNILLDENFNAKLSDFGLSRLLDRQQSQVVTNMRGTPGYMAPEWLSSVITEKVDVYSFGVVMLEILCGRKVVDRTEPEERMYLLNIFNKKEEEGKLRDMIDQSSEDMQSHGEEIMEITRLALWCLQSDYTRRPSMSVVVKVLEGFMSVETNLDHIGFQTPEIFSVKGVSQIGSKEEDVLVPSVLSGPR